MQHAATGSRDLMSLESDIPPQENGYPDMFPEYSTHSCNALDLAFSHENPVGKLGPVEHNCPGSQQDDSEPSHRSPYDL